MNRLEQDAADTLEAYEQKQEWRGRALADRDRAMQPAPPKTWAPTMTEQQKQEQAQHIKQHGCPF